MSGRCINPARSDPGCVVRPPWISDPARGSTSVRRRVTANMIAEPLHRVEQAPGEIGLGRGNHVRLARSPRLHADRRITPNFRDSGEWHAVSTRGPQSFAAPSINSTD